MRTSINGRKIFMAGHILPARQPPAHWIVKRYLSSLEALSRLILCILDLGILNGYLGYDKSMCESYSILTRVHKTTSSLRGVGLFEWFISIWLSITW